MPQLLALLVGCNYVDNPQGLPVLRGAEDDALNMAAALHSHPPSNGDLGSLTLLLGASATVPAIRAALGQALARPTDEDTLLFYFAGHGSRDDKGLILHTWDEQWRAGQLLDEFGLDPRSTAVILDCCHAGAISLDAAHD